MSTEDRFGEVGESSGEPGSSALGNGNGGFGPAAPLGDFGASGPLLGSLSASTSSSDLSVTSLPKNDGWLSGIRGASEREFYSRQPATPFVHIGEHKIDSHSLSHVQRTSNGNFQIAEGKVVTAEEFKKIRNVVASTELSYADDVKKWRDEGIARGYVYSG